MYLDKGVFFNKGKSNHGTRLSIDPNTRWIFGGKGKGSLGDVGAREERMEGTSGRFDYPRVWGTRKLIKKHIRAKERRSLGDGPRQLEQLCTVPYQTPISANLWQSLQLPLCYSTQWLCPRIPKPFSQACAFNLHIEKKTLKLEVEKFQTFFSCTGTTLHVCFPSWNSSVSLPKVSNSQVFMLPRFSFREKEVG